MYVVGNKYAELIISVTYGNYCFKYKYFYKAFIAF